MAKHRRKNKPIKKILRQYHRRLKRKKVRKSMFHAKLAGLFGQLKNL